VKTLIVGGNGFVGGYAALYFQELGHEVTILSRTPPKGTSRLNDLPWVRGDYVNDDFSDGRLEGYDWLIFAAGNDLGQYVQDGSVSEEEYFEKTNVTGLPRFFEAAKRAGIPRAVYMGSFYSFVAPENIATIPYVRSRHLSDAAILALSAPGFNVCSCALPWIVGHVPGLPVAHWQALAQYAAGKLAGIPEFAPPGGANFMTCRAVAEAMLGGLERGQSGKSYLIGDVNMSWKDYFELWFAAAGRPRDLEVRSGHPIVPDFALSYLSYGIPDYDPPAAETALLGYQRGLLLPEIEACQRYYRDL
jgi:nucleoside-diphosphate-sugar epimerase